MKEFCIAKEAIAPDGPVPEPGDAVTVELAGAVDRIDGDRIYLREVTTNGVPVPQEAPEVPEEERVREMAAAADREDTL
ncbi:MAG: hypothetical protein JSS23_12275 [Proteobacteria bacterium]|nr:hypothetical protein [Pseudomonadota bacterium]